MALGRTGTGKSSLLNDLLGTEVFRQKLSTRSQTVEIQEHSGFWAPLRPYIANRDSFGCDIRVIDTPGFGDTENRDKEFLPHIKNAIDNAMMSEGGIHCILLIFKISSNYDTLCKTLQTLIDLMQPKDDFWHNILLVFTHVDVINGTLDKYYSYKHTLKTKISDKIKETFGLQHTLPMLWISTQKYKCGLTKDTQICDCARANRFHADSRRRLFEKVWERRGRGLTIECNENKTIV